MADNVRDIIQQAAVDQGVDPNTLLTIARIESNFNPNASNPSGAAGLFQLMPATATEQGVTDPYDAAANAAAAARITATNTRALTRTLGREPTAGELYLAHQQGLAGARAILGHPEETAVEALSRAYGGSTARATAAIRQNGGDPNAPASQFASMWTARIDQAAGLLPPSNVPSVATAYADTSTPLPRSRDSGVSARLNSVVNGTFDSLVAPSSRSMDAGTSLAFDPVSGGKLSIPQMDAGFDPNMGAMRFLDQAKSGGYNGVTDAQRTAMAALPIAAATAPVPAVRQSAPVGPIMAATGSGHFNPRSGAEYSPAQWQQVQQNQAKTASSIATTGAPKTDYALRDYALDQVGQKAQAAQPAIDAAKTSAIKTAANVASSVGGFLGNFGSAFSHPQEVATATANIPLGPTVQPGMFGRVSPPPSSGASATKTNRAVQQINPDYTDWINAKYDPIGNGAAVQFGDLAAFKAPTAPRPPAPPKYITVQKPVVVARPPVQPQMQVAPVPMPMMRAANGGIVTQGANGNLNSITQASDQWRMMTGQGGGGGYSNGSIV